MKGQQIIAYAIIILIISAATANSTDTQPFIEFRDSGAIDWTKGIVSARGIVEPSYYSHIKKTPEQRRQILAQALNKARHNLLETIVGIRINAESRVIDVVENYPDLMSQLRGMTYQAPEIDNLRRELFDGTVEENGVLSMSSFGDTSIRFEAAVSGFSRYGLW